VARRVRLWHLDRSIAPAFCTKQSRPARQWHDSCGKRKGKEAWQLLTRTHLCRPKRDLLCASLLQLQSPDLLRLTDKTTRCHLGAQATPSNPSSRAPTDPACRTRSQFVSAGECQGMDTAVCSYMATTRANFESCGYCILSAPRVAPGTRFG
jgi:hypothetical protein